jgi:DinB superfamily
MSTSTATNLTISTKPYSRILQEGYGPGAWHGADLRAAIADVTAPVAFWRPAAGRHNIAEIALHHAYCARAVRQKLSGQTAEPFVLQGDDWFALTDDARFPWSKVQATVEAEQSRLTALVADAEGGKLASPLADDERFNLVLGITCHAVYHAGQIQLIKRLRAE